MKKTAYFCLVFSLLTAMASSAPAIVNGIEVGKKTIGSGGPEDYVLGLTIKTSVDSGKVQTGFCTGVLISPKALLTANHCVKDKGQGMRVSAGINSESGTNVSIEKVFRMDNYDKTDDYADSSKKNDLAIVQIKEIPRGYKIAQLPGLNDQLAAHQNLTLIGYGRTSFDHRNVEDMGRLRKGQNNIYTYTTDGFLRITQTTLPGVCQGDSGGPLMLASPTTGFTVWGIARGAGKDWTPERLRIIELIRSKLSKFQKKYAEALKDTTAADDMELAKNDPAAFFKKYETAIMASAKADDNLAQTDPERFLSKYQSMDLCKGSGVYSDVRKFLPWIESVLNQIGN